MIIPNKCHYQANLDRSWMTSFLDKFRDDFNWLICRFAIGNKLTYVDLALLQVLRAADSSFPDTYSEQIDNFPLLKAHRTRIENRPNLQTYFKSERSRAMEGKSMM